MQQDVTVVLQKYAGTQKILSVTSVQAATLKRSATNLTCPRIFSLPFSRNGFFTGREEVLNRLYQNFNSSDRTQALNGLGGIGKTQTAVKYAYRHRQDYEVVLWAGANTRETLVADYAAIAGLLDLPEKNAQDQGEAVAASGRGG